MKLIIETEVIKDLLETEWGYEGIKDDLDDLFAKNGIPLEKIKTEIEQTASRYCISRERGVTGQVLWSDRLTKVSEVSEIIDRYIKGE